MSILDSSEINHVEDFGGFIEASPSSYHAAQTVARRLEARGFKQMLETDPMPVQPGGHFFIRDGAVIAWFIPEGVEDPTFRIVGCHTDSPGLKVKPSGSSSTPDGWGQIDVEMYGGLLLNSWLDREIGFAGRVILRDGTERLVQTGPIARVPQLAIHLDRDINSGFKLDKQKHMQPVWTLGDKTLFEHIGDLLGVEAKDIVGHDLMSYAVQPPARFGLDGEFFAAGRQDNLSSVHAGLTALERMQDSDFADIAVFAAFDHEEVGSSTRSGASGPILETTLRRIAAGLGRDEDGYHRMLAGTTCISADAGHFVHPNYAERHDPNNHPMPGAGPMLKLNANQRYASDAVGAGLWSRACEAAEVPSQAFVSNNSVPCGSTIGPLTATRLGITTVDVGIGLLSMHSAREMSHVSDHLMLSRVLEEYWKGA
ncbi:MAG: M18 family aminopeptidase [Actinomycetaceae bacterium]|nr:M18 family aminopeptidase [Actinomycetaceae bacterium]